MARNIPAVLLALTVAAGISCVPALAQSDIISTNTEMVAPIDISTDAESYDHSSVISVDGQVKSVKVGIPVTLVVTGPNGNIVFVDQLAVDVSGRYSTMLNTDGPLWQYDGRYTAKVQYGSESITNKAHFDLTGGIDFVPVTPMPEPPPAADCSAGELAVGSSCVPFTLSGGAVSSATASFAGEGAGNVLAVTVNAQEDGTISLSPNAPACGAEDYVVIVNGEQWDDYVVSDGQVTVSFMQGQNTVEIIGTCVVPEFGAIAAVVLAAALVAVLAASRTRAGSIMPKY